MIRRHLRLGLATACVALSTLAALLGCGDDGPPTPARVPAAAPADFLGLVSEDLIGGDESYRRRTLARQRAIGVRLLRQTFDWSRIEKAPGRYDLRFYDRYVASLARERLRVLPVLFDPPSFRSSAPARGARRGTYPPRRPRDLGRLGAVLARRYGPNGSLWSERPDLPKLPIRSWQVWNEPSLPVYWASGPDPAEYVALLKSTRRGIRSVDPGAEIVSAGLAESRLGIPFAQFVRGMFRAGAGRALDTLALHPYAADAGDAVQAVASARRLIRQAGDDAPIWITEIGWATGGPPSPFRVTRSRQAELVRDALGELTRRRRELGVRGVVYFNWKDSRPFAGGSDFFGLHTGLLDIGGRPKPALAAYRRASQALR